MTGWQITGLVLIVLVVGPILGAFLFDEPELTLLALLLVGAIAIGCALLVGAWTP